MIAVLSASYVTLIPRSQKLWRIGSNYEFITVNNPSLMVYVILHGLQNRTPGWLHCWPQGYSQAVRIAR
jgi:hypothetical protein